MLAGVIDYAIGNVLAGWVRSDHPTEITVIAAFDGQNLSGGCVQDPGDPHLVKYRLSLPRPITAGELASRTVIIEARNATERRELEIWRPLLLAAELEQLEDVPLDRVLRSMSPAGRDRLAKISQNLTPVANRPGDAGMFDDLMRWS